MRTKEQEPKVLIVGAGPVGMLLALELALYGVQARVISRDVRVSPHSKATIVWPRILELMDRTGVSEAIVREGHYFDQMNYYSNKKRVGLIRFNTLSDTPYPFGITIPQAKTERILESALTAQGIAIEYGCEFVSGEQDLDSVSVTLRDRSGAEQRCSFDWVVGADGFQSSVRSAFEFDFSGYSMPIRLAITDAELTGQTTSSEAAYYMHRSGNMVLAPLGDGVFRVGASVPPEYTGDRPDREFFNTLLEHRVPGVKKLGEMKFSGIFTAHVRTANRFKKNRVFIVGDAAHAMSPSGAQGLNTGFQDAVNLGWKLGGVIRGSLSPDILESYTRERLESVNRVSALSTSLARMSLYRRTPQIVLRDAAFKVASLTRVLENYVSPRFAQLDSSIAKPDNRLFPGKKRSFCAGDRIPLSWTENWQAPVLAKDAYSILLWPGKTYVYETWSAFSQELDAAMPGHKVINLGAMPLGKLLDRLGARPQSIIVRPDGHIQSIVALDAAAYAKGIDAISNALPHSLNLQ
ncbi:FAD-dependent oxidoreductase [Pseudomonas saponiphila]|uniref:2-polyprenyl-6-methoxyphenol hydroxylase n=1 Tax=Pseudomonas saponiphila TaxID=556534 RepID=A0A1H4K6M2_9PSED|nr:FAD-dependent monooxygenase [Pseudomonas saponiphila]SEB53956.1 2-polyprenyl-6-methoxyphenol hydroxylase [Pseudomonas saponiphila]